MEAVTGSRVLYKLSSGDAADINRRRADFEAFNRANRGTASEPGQFPGRSGHVGHYGNLAVEGDVYPADVVRTFGSNAAVNLHVHLDGNDCYWASSRGEGSGPGQWSWAGTVIAGFAARLDHAGDGTAQAQDAPETRSGL